MDNIFTYNTSTPSNFENNISSTTLLHSPQPYINQEVDEQYERDNFLKNLRIKRNALLEETDWTVLPDSPLSEEKKVQYLVYRQALRNLPQTQTYDTLIWPLRP